MKNRAFKIWCVNHYGNINMLAKAVKVMLIESNRALYDIMDECNAKFNDEGYRQCAEFIFNQVTKTDIRI